MSHSVHNAAENAPEILTETKAEEGVQPVAPASIDTRLERIEQSIDKLRDQLPAPKQSYKDKGRGALAGAFALTGLLGGSILGAKVVYLSTGVPLAVDKIGYWISKEKSALKPVSNDAFLSELLVGGTIGGVIGAGFGALLGVFRGDRLDNPDDLFTHPLESMKKIFGSAPKVEAVFDDANAIASEPQKSTQISAPQHEGTVAVAPSKNRDAA